MRMSSKGFGFIVIAGLALCTGVAKANDIYIAQSAAGSANGSNCANAYAATFFNTAANWGSGANKIGPGTTVHLCGTISVPSRRKEIEQTAHQSRLLSIVPQVAKFLCLQSRPREF